MKTPIPSKLRTMYSRRVEYRGDARAVRQLEGMIEDRKGGEIRWLLALARRFGRIDMGLVLCERWRDVRDLSLLETRDDLIIEEMALALYQMALREPQLKKHATHAVSAMLRDPLLTSETVNQVRVYLQLIEQSHLPRSNILSKEELGRAIAEAALLRGEFTLRSGRKSAYYLDKYLFTTRPDLLRPLARLFAQRINEITEFRASVDRLAGAELGAVPLVTGVGLETGLPFVLVRNRKKDYGSAKRIEGKIEAKDRVILVEDIATTGGQAIEATAALREAGARVLACVTVIDREEGARENMLKAKIRFEALFTKSDLGV